jgi:Inosine-uridine preferring nucleoside hydrolase
MVSSTGLFAFRGRSFLLSMIVVSSSVIVVAGADATVVLDDFSSNNRTTPNRDEAVTESTTSEKKRLPPVIFDTDYGPFIDDVFALGLIINSFDLLDLRAVITTSEQPDLSARCVAKHLKLSDKLDIPVLIGDELPSYDKRGGVCAIPNLIGFPLADTCDDGEYYPSIQNDGVKYLRRMIRDSKRDDWWYIAVGGQTSLKKLITKYPNAAKKINTIVIMGGNWCTGFQPYPGVGK